LRWNLVGEFGQQTGNSTRSLPGSRGVVAGKSPTSLGNYRLRNLILLISPSLTISTPTVGPGRHAQTIGTADVQTEATGESAVVSRSREKMNSVTAALRGKASDLRPSDTIGALRISMMRAEVSLGPSRDWTVPRTQSVRGHHGLQFANATSRSQVISPSRGRQLRSAGHRR